MRLVSSYITFKNNPDLYGYTTDWGSTSSNFQIYMLAPPNITASNIDAQLKVFSEKNYHKRKNGVKTNFAQPLKDVHFDTRMEITVAISLTKARFGRFLL